MSRKKVRIEHRIECDEAGCKAVGEWEWQARGDRQNDKSEVRDAAQDARCLNKDARVDGASHTKEQSEQSESDESDGDDEVTRPSRPSTSESTPRKTWRCQSSHGFSVPDA